MKNTILLSVGLLVASLPFAFAFRSSLQAQTVARAYAQRQYEFLDHGKCLYDRSTAFSGVYNEWAVLMQKEVIDLALMREVADHFAQLEACPSWPEPRETEKK